MLLDTKTPRPVFLLITALGTSRSILFLKTTTLVYKFIDNGFPKYFGRYLKS